MTQQEFLTRWENEKAAYAAWGSFVRDSIEKCLAAEDPTVDLQVFLKITVKPRLKTDDSLIDKAYGRNKKYANPYLEIEDKVGLRFVVLLVSDIQKIQLVVNASPLWNASLDKDFEAERESRPREFSYQSTHYVLKSKTQFVFDGVVVSAGTPCEVQLRTLLQHAHSELTHDNIYKIEPGKEVSRKVERTVAKSMALIEAVDDYFEIAIKELKDAGAVERNALEALKSLYKHNVSLPPVAGKSATLVLAAYRNSLSDELPTQITSFLAKHSFVVERIKERYDTNHLFRQAWILLVYFLVSSAPRTTSVNWPLTKEELQPIYTDLSKPLN